MADTYTQTYEISLVPGKLPKPVVTLSQYDDTLRILKFHIVEEYTLDTETYVYGWTLRGTKRNGLGFQLSGSFNANTRTISFEVSKSLTESAGLIDAEIRIKRMRKQVTSPVSTYLGTANFLLNIEPSPHPDGITDGTRSEVIDQITQLVDEATQASTTAVQNATSATHSATSAKESATTATEKATKIESYYSQMVTEKLTDFITLQSGTIDWANSSVYRTGDRIHGLAVLTDASTSTAITFSDDEYKPADASYGTAYSEDSEPVTGYIITADTLRINQPAGVLILSLDYTIQTTNTYEDGDNLSY